MFKEVLVEGFKPEEGEYDGYVQNIEEDLHGDATRLLEATCKDLNSHLNRKF